MVMRPPNDFRADGPAPDAGHRIQPPTCPSRWFSFGSPDYSSGPAAIFNCGDNKIASFSHALSNTVEKGASRQKSPQKAKTHRKTWGCGHGGLLTRYPTRDTVRPVSRVTTDSYGDSRPES